LRTTRLLLRSFEPKDIPAIARLAGARGIAAMTLNIPHPYTEDDAAGKQAREGANSPCRESSRHLEQILA
jgi:hypothetical protein